MDVPCSGSTGPCVALIMHNLKAFFFGAVGISTLIWTPGPAALAQDRLVQGPVQGVRFALDPGGPWKVR